MGHSLEWLAEVYADLGIAPLPPKVGLRRERSAERGFCAQSPPKYYPRSLAMGDLGFPERQPNGGAAGGEF
jgi:hypothetical protein